MKKIFVFASSLAVVLLVGFACKKSTTTTTSSTSTSSTTGSTTTASTNTTTTNFSVDGTAVSNISTPTGQPDPTAGSNQYDVLAFASSGSPSIQISFTGTVTPANGSYTIISGTTPSAGKCCFLFTNSTGYATPTGGTVTVVGKDAYFTNVVCSVGTAGTHTVSGNLIWP